MAHKKGQGSTRNGRDSRGQRRGVKLFAGETANRVIDRCLQFHGGWGYMDEYTVSRAFRDVRLLTIGGGTSEVMREIIAKLEGY